MSRTYTHIYVLGTHQVYSQWPKYMSRVRDGGNAPTSPQQWEGAASSATESCHAVRFGRRPPCIDVLLLVHPLLFHLLGNRPACFVCGCDRHAWLALTDYSAFHFFPFTSPTEVQPIMVKMLTDYINSFLLICAYTLVRIYAKRSVYISHTKGMFITEYEYGGPWGGSGMSCIYHQQGWYESMMLIEMFECTINVNTAVAEWVGAVGQ